MHIIIGLLIVFLVMALLRNRKTRYCRWRRDKSGDKGNLQKYHCVTCGYEAYTAQKGEPKTCGRVQTGGPKL
jgi:hypothetical protein